MIRWVLERLRQSADRRRHRNDRHGLIYITVIDGGKLPPRKIEPAK